MVQGGKLRTRKRDLFLDGKRSNDGIWHRCGSDCCAEYARMAEPSRLSDRTIRAWLSELNSPPEGKGNHAAGQCLSSA